MEFLLIKTLDMHDDYNDLPPHKKAYQKNYDRIEGRTCTEEYFDAHHAAREGTWRSKGVAHKKTKGGKFIQRRFPGDSKGWFIEIGTLEELIKFIDKEGPIVLSGGEIPKIEIYNDYRE